MGYAIRGHSLEVCGCHVMCPCSFEQDPDENECTGMVAWYVEQDQLKGVGVSGVIDGRVIDGQAQALANAITRRQGAFDLDLERRSVNRGQFAYFGRDEA